MRRVSGRVLWASAAVLVLGVAAACGSGSSGGGGGTGGGGGGATPVNSSTCQSVQNSSGKYLITSDFPLNGSSAHQTKQMNQAIAMVLEQNNWKAGKYTLAFQPCDDSTPQAGTWDSTTCSANANAYAADPSVIGNIGTFNSGCAELEVPVLNQAQPGPIPMVSPANTWPGLTQGTKVPAEPSKYYPTGTRNYARVVAPDNFQGPALALTAKKLGVHSVYILNDKQAYGAGVAQYFEDAAKKLGLQVLGNSAYNTKTGTNYQALFQGINSKHPDAIMVGGLICENGGQLIKDKVSVLGDNNKVKLLLPDGFTTSETITDAGKASEGLYASVAGLPTEQLKGAGKTFISEFQSKFNPDFIDPYTPYAAAATQVLLKAIAASDGTRASVSQNLFSTQITDSVLGSFSISKTGDTDQGSMTVDVVKNGKLTTFDVLTPPANLVETFPAR
ncbi:MAG TPA: branched-chain amino acid ABC transporter substrate-binding protein [Gaiellales bacterium]|nr:branched-chain amino acid ABC transporter substrate-binding protein [Gaiellales bacterium]